MKRTLLCAAALLSMSSMSFAADLPSRAVAAAPIYLAPAFSWTGFYVGGNVGAVWGGSDTCPGRETAYKSDSDRSYGGIYTLDKDYLPNCNGGNKVGVIGGVQAGYNWAFGGWLFGLEGDINWLGRNNGNGYEYAVPGVPDVGLLKTTVENHLYSWSGHNNSNTLGTIRARFGFTTDRTLFFVTGGAAFRNGDNNATITDTTQTITKGNITKIVTYDYDHKVYNGSGSGNNFGWALGGGLEYALTENISTKIEYLHAQFSNGGNGYSSSAGDDCQRFFGDSKNSIDIVRVGLNYRFVTAAPTAVLARY